MTVTWILAISIVLHLIGAALALRMIRICERKPAWLLIALAIAVLAIQKSFVLVSVMSSQTTTDSLITEITGLLVPILAIVGMVMLIPVFRRSQESQMVVQDNEASFAAVVEHMPVMINALDRNGNIVMWNRECERVTGYTADEIVGNPDAMAMLYPDQAYRELIAEQRKQLGPGYRNFEWNITCTDGSTRTVSWSNISHEAPIEGWATWSIGVDITDRKRAEGAMRQSEQWFRTLFETANLGIVVARRNGRLAQANQFLLILLGYEPDEIKKHTMAGLIHPDDRDDFRHAGTQTSCLPDRNTGLELRFMHADGGIVSAHTTIAWIFDKRQQAMYSLFVIYDITDLKRTEQALRMSEARFHNLFDQSPDAIFVESHEGIVLDANAAACELHGVDLDYLIGKNVVELVPPDRREQVAQEFQRLVRDELNQIEGFSWNFHGNAVPIELRASHVLYSGQEAMLLHVRDMTKRREAEEALRESQDRFRLLVENAPIGIHEMDLTGHIQVSNACGRRMLDIGEYDEIINKDYLDIVSDEDRKRVERLISSATNGDPNAFEFTAIGTESPRAFAASVIPIRDADDTITRLLAITQDVTQRKRAEQEKTLLEAELRQAQKLEAVGTLASGVAHDFNNLLTAISGYAQLARKTLPSEEDAVKSLDMIEKAAQQAQGVTRSLLTFSHKTSSNKSPVDLGNLATESMRLLRRLLPPSVEVVQTSPKDTSVWVNADATQLQQVIMNLAVNARDAMPEGGELRVEVSQTCAEHVTGEDRPTRDQFEAVLVIEDSGAGMDKQTMSRVFEPFFTTKARSEGTGLGLSLVHGIVTDHNGRIRLESEIGKGTRFSIVLPTCEAPEEVKQPETPEEHLGAGELVILAEDNDYVRTIMATTLEQAGYETITANDGEEAIKAMDTHEVRTDLVVLDLDLPKISGRACLEHVRQKRPDLPVLIVTGSVKLADIQNELRPNEKLMRKPFQMGDLLTQVNETLTATGKANELV